MNMRMREQKTFRDHFLFVHLVGYSIWQNKEKSIVLFHQPGHKHGLHQGHIRGDLGKDHVCLTSVGPLKIL